MRCPICDNKPMNCDCTPEDRRQFSEIEDLQDEVARLRLTPAEREAVRFFSQVDGPQNVPVANRRAATLRGLLARLEVE